MLYSSGTQQEEVKSTERIAGLTPKHEARFTSKGLNASNLFSALAVRLSAQLRWQVRTAGH